MAYTISKPRLYCEKSITVNLKPELDQFIRDLSKDLEITMNYLINVAVEEYMRKMKGDNCEKVQSS